MTQHIVERQVVEDFDEHRIGDCQRRGVCGKKLFVISTRPFTDYHVFTKRCRLLPLRDVDDGSRILLFA